MNDASNEAAAKMAHEKAFAAIGNPSTTPLQIDAALASLKVAIDVHAEMVRALIRRVEPVSAQGMRFTIGSCTINGSVGGVASSLPPPKAPIASSILCQHEIIEDLTKELQQAIRELQV
jgi:hypothetical protein